MVRCGWAWDLRERRAMASSAACCYETGAECRAMASNAQSRPVLDTGKKKKRVCRGIGAATLRAEPGQACRHPHGTDQSVWRAHAPGSGVERENRDSGSTESPYGPTNPSNGPPFHSTNFRYSWALIVLLDPRAQVGGGVTCQPCVYERPQRQRARHSLVRDVA